jgi:hypothetical protein
MPLLLALASPAWPCAGLVTPDSTEQLAASDAQQAILTIGAETVSAEYRVRYSGDAADFAWIIPVPGEVVSVDEGDEARFVAIEEATAPTVGYWNPNDDQEATGCACGPRSKGSDNVAGGLADTGTFGGEPSGVAILGSGFAGDYAYQIVDATSTDGLVGWLEAQGYDPSISAPAIEAYEADPIGFTWVAVQLRPEVAQTPEGGVTLTPLRITWGAAGDGELHASYPARMASTSMLAEVRTELYVLAPSMVDPGNGWTAQSNWQEGYGYSFSGNAGDDPVDVYTAGLESIGGTHPVLYTAFTGAYDDALAGATFVTRYDTIVAPATNQTDVVFTENGTTEEIYTLIGIPTEAPAYAPTAAWLLPLGLGGLALRRRDRAPSRA